ncbi:MAG: hypothetical protein ACOH1J_00035 [Microbacteriaceae bacterium]
MAAELQLALAYELTAENAPRFAEDIIAQAGSQGISLDYSASTLDYLDSVVASLRANHVTFEQVPEVIFGFGCMLGEIIAQANNGSWIKANFAVPLGVRHADGRVVDPIGHAFSAISTGITFRSFV